MKCLFEHDWGWPRKRGGKDIQVCLHCGTERESKVHFGEPRYRKTQDGLTNSASARTVVAESGFALGAGEVASAAA
ncbi:MAG TPA: hypothetical protein VF767_06160 [Bryobacteraceae bacterium]